LKRELQVVFDYQVFYLQRYGGISRYFCALAGQLHAGDQIACRIVAPYHANAYLTAICRQPYVLTFGPALRKVFYNRFLDRRIGLNRLFTRLIARQKKTVIHETYYTERFRTGCPVVITIHDMIYEKFHSGLEGEKRVIADKKKAIEQADAIIAVSENTRRDLLSFYPFVGEKTVVIHHGVDEVDYNMVTPFDHPRPYLLFVGNRGWYKNFTMLFEVFCTQTQVGHRYDLICFGGGNGSEEEMLYISEKGMDGRIHFLSGDDEMLHRLYKSAAMLVYNSRYEGFGLPVLEAMQAGCPVIASDSSSLPEVCGDAAVMVQPESREQLLQAILKIDSDTAFSQRMIQAGKIRAAQFTWKKCAGETLKVYTKLLNG
jgi:glycosyltransferase involved in cell wall biosynthesis